jgi:apolipoprotein D and lipocalin family protein
MGKWYVIAHIPIDTFFASEANAYDAVEAYELDDDGTTIRTTFTFREGGFDGEKKVMKPTGFVVSDSNTEWRMQFLWPFKSAYLIVYLDDDYETTIVSVPDRSYAWIMARTAQISDHRYQSLVDELRGMGHDLSKLRKVPQSTR